MRVLYIVCVLSWFNFLIAATGSKTWYATEMCSINDCPHFKLCFPRFMWLQDGFDVINTLSQTRKDQRYLGHARDASTATPVHFYKPRLMFEQPTLTRPFCAVHQVKPCYDSCTWNTYESSVLAADGLLGAVSTTANT